MSGEELALITGADGFIGSHLAEHLVRNGYKVRALAAYNSFNDLGWLEYVDCLDEIEVRTGDIRDPRFCDSITEDVNIVFHLAALIGIPYSYVSPDSYVDTNIRGTLNVCQAALRNKVQRLVHTSTSEVYGTAQYVPIDEKHPLQPQSPYSATKIGADAIALSFHHAFGLPLAIARPFNTFGPRQSARAVIPTIIGQIASGADEIKLGDVSPTRDFSYVEDTCGGFLAIAQCDEAVGKTLNIGSNTEIKISDTVEILKEIMNSEAKLIVDDQRLRPESSEVFRLYCDNSLLAELTGYTPKHSLRDGLEKTVDWFIRPENLRKYKTQIYNI